MKVNRLRLAVQFFCFVILVYGGLWSIDMGNRMPTFTCAYMDDRGGGCFLIGFQHMLERPFSEFLGGAGIRLAKALGIVALWSIVLNKAWCGWVCPFGFLQDLMSKLRTFLSIDLSRFAWATRKRNKSIKYILLILLILIPLGIANSVFSMQTLPRDWSVPFCQICPARIILPIFNGDFSELHIDFSSNVKILLTSLGIVTTGLFFTTSFVKRRFLCSYCPMLAVLSLFDKIGLLTLKKDGQSCTRCGNCSRACPMEIREIEEEKTLTNLVTQDCTLCLRCVEVCPEENTLDARFCGISIFSSTKSGFLKRQGLDEKNNNDAGA
jgi:ferredoxin-type protein NapH